MNPAVPLALTAVLVLCLAQTSAGPADPSLSFSLTVPKRRCSGRGTVAAFWRIGHSSFTSTADPRSSANYLDIRIKKNNIVAICNFTMIIYRFSRISFGLINS